jgi:hypothetical protein
MLTDYLKCALWSSTNCDDDPLDCYFDVRDFATEAIGSANDDLNEFWEQAKPYIKEDVQERQVAHDFWLTRNGHGSGFWDRPEIYGEANAEKLTEIAKTFGEKYVYVHNDYLYFE